MSRLFISFSGGATSAYMAQAYMAQMVKNNPGEFSEIVTVFANTGQENEETLEFVDKCDKHFGLNVVWVEAEIHPEKGQGTRHRIVDFHTADRSGRKSFEPMIVKYGIPSPDMPHCTRVLKTEAMYSYIHSIWERDTYKVAIGIRADEVDRMTSNPQIIYPLLRSNITRNDINRFWAQMPFRLQLKGYEGNCKWCWKKTLRKHVTIMREHPERFDFPREMEAKYPMAGALAQKTGKPQRFFRKYLTVADIEKAAADLRIENADDDSVYVPDLLDYMGGLDIPAGGCTDSCEPFIDEQKERPQS